MVIIMVMIVVLSLIMTSRAIMAGDETGCHHLLVHGADKADCRVAPNSSIIRYSRIVGTE